MDGHDKDFIIVIQEAIILNTKLIKTLNIKLSEDVLT